MGKTVSTKTKSVRLIVADQTADYVYDQIKLSNPAVAVNHREAIQLLAFDIAWSLLRYSVPVDLVKESTLTAVTRLFK